MLPPTTQDAPSPWSVIADFAKTIITLAAALLTLTVTFSQDVVGRTGSGVLPWLIIGLWLTLVIGILAGALTLMFSVNVLMDGSNRRECIFSSNTAWVCLLVSGILLAGIGYLRIVVPLPWTASKTIEEVTSRMPELTGQKGTQWRITVLCWNSKGQFYMLIMRNPDTGEKWTVIVDPARGQISRYGKHRETTKHAGPC